MITDNKMYFLVDNVDYAFLDKVTKASTSRYKNKDIKLLKMLQMKCAPIDVQTKLTAKLAFNNCRISFGNTAINFLTRLEQKVNETRTFDIKMSERRFI